MTRITYASAFILLSSLAVVACDSDADADADGNGGNTTTSSSSGTGGDTTSSSGTGGSTTSSGTGGTGGSGSTTLFHCDAETYAQDAMDNGIVLFNGVTLPESTPIDDILADTAGFTDQVVRIEGFATEICSSQGCYVNIESVTGELLNLKLTDGVLDFRDYVIMGNYAIGEGVFSPSGEHGAQVYIQDHGAVISALACSE